MIRSTSGSAQASRKRRAPARSAASGSAAPAAPAAIRSVIPASTSSATAANRSALSRNWWYRAPRVTPAARTISTERLVIGGLYRYVRNPMYLAVVAVITGQGLALGQPVLLGYAAVVWVTVASFVRGYEEPALARQFGAQYRAYRRSVPAWLPRIRPWRPGGEVPDSRAA